MRKMLLSVCVALAVFSCGGDDGDLPPCLTCTLCGSHTWNSYTEFCSEGTVFPKSSSSALPSSSSFAPSSSSVPTFACAMAATAGTVGVAITPAPAVTCNGVAVTAGLAWTPVNLTPTAAGSVLVSVSASSGVCSGMATQCGSVTVSPPTLACTMTATTGTVGVAITPVPAVTCNGSTVTTGLAWTPANLTPTTAGSISVSVSASSGVCSGMAVGCGSVAVPDPLACTMTVTTGTVGAVITPAPVATCNGTAVTTGLTWTPASLTPTAAGNVSVSVVAGSGVCSGFVAQCGSVTVSAPSYGSLPYESQSYKTIKIGTQTWMAENLNYNAPDSRCYGDNTGGDSQNRCGTYGRLYDWSTAMALPSSCNYDFCSSQIQSPHQGICPDGWHIPSRAEWDVLMTAVGGSRTAGTKLKATSGWNSGGNGTDDYGFSALPGGSGQSEGSFNSVGNYGNWWNADGSISLLVYNQDMYNVAHQTGWGNLGLQLPLFSVRCVQD